MASKGDVGIDIDVSKVPLREPGMEPFEIMISESQERMLCVVEPTRLKQVVEICQKWETLATAIGEVTGSGHVRILNGEDLVGDLPVHTLVDDCPLYDLEPAPPDGSALPFTPRKEVRAGGGAAGDDEGETLLALLASPNLCSRLPVYEQYDWIVQSRTVRRPDQADAAVLRLPDGSAIAVSIDGNGRRVASDPRRGAAEAVLECAANLACVGAEPLGATNCLNFGNPEKPEVAWQLTEAVEGIAEACEALEVPIVGGNVSLYNESPDGPIYPTPVIGMVGKLPDAVRPGRLGFLQEGDAIALVGQFEPSRGGAQLDGRPGPLPDVDPGSVREAHAAVRDGVRSGTLQSAHDLAEGGLAVAVAECCLAGEIGARIELPNGFDLFGEAPGRAFVVSGPPAALERFTMIGRVGGDALEIAGRLEVPLSELRAAHDGGLRYA
jgi:phosphoribosylformylglycinamidine synthase